MSSPIVKMKMAQNPYLSVLSSAVWLYRITQKSRIIEVKMGRGISFFGEGWGGDSI